MSCPFIIHMNDSSLKPSQTHEMPFFPLHFLLVPSCLVSYVDLNFNSLYFPISLGVFVETRKLEINMENTFKEWG